MGKWTQSGHRYFVWGTYKWLCPSFKLQQGNLGCRRNSNVPACGSLFWYIYICHEWDTHVCSETRILTWEFKVVVIDRAVGKLRQERGAVPSTGWQWQVTHCVRCSADDVWVYPDKRLSSCQFIIRIPEINTSTTTFLLSFSIYTLPQTLWSYGNCALLKCCHVYFRETRGAAA